VTKPSRGTIAKIVTAITGSTMIVIVGMLDPRWKVEIEADAVID